MQRTSRWHGRTPLAALGLAIAVTALPSAGIASVGTQTERPTSAAGASRTATTGATRARGAAKGPLGGTGIVRWGSTYPTASGYERYAYVLIGTNDARAAARLPGMSLVYMSGTSVQTSWSTGVSYDEARANDWLLKDASGAYVRNEQYGAYVGDIGDVGYQQRFANNVVAVLRASHADGVFIDDVIGDALALTGGAIPSTYPTSDAWESAMVSFVSRVGTLLKARGFYVLVSATKFVSGDLRSNTGEHVTEFWRRLAPSVDGLMAEYWLQSPIDVAQLRTVGTRWYENWAGWQSLVSVAQKAGVDFFGRTYGSGNDSRAMRYVRGSFLLDWNGKGGAVIYSATDRADPYHPAWVKQLGTPVRAKFERLSGVWQRRYSRGIVVVNATNAPVTVRVNRALRTIGATDALMVSTTR